jgi:hypothetical protein
MKNYILKIIVLVCCSLSGQAQTTILPLNSYGVWDRSNAYNIAVNTDYNYLRGISADVNWEEVQATDSIQYDWSAIQTILQSAYNNNQMVNVSVGVGPDAPAWAYTNGVPGVTTNDIDHPNWTRYPYYLDSDYKRYYFKMIESFGNFLRSQPAHLFSRIAYIQVKTGCTGDEVAYKGTPLNAAYTISNAAWRTFRLAAFEQFRLTFNTGNSSTQIGLLFNNIDPVDEPTEWQWVNNNVTYGFGTKGGAYARGHHLSDEQDFKNTWTPYLVNPQGLKLFSAAEMDQTWTKPYYQINVPLGFYWGALSGLNTGLSVWLVTQSALQAAQTKPELHDVFRMFNKYANQIYPSTANAAYTIFHEGLNSKNTTKFPVSIYGAANQSNQARYIAICNAYAAKGAQMDHVFAATKGQVWQRDNQTGYNDAGWIIEEGNYEKWITQINPDATSIGLFRVRGTLNTSSSMYDRFARSFQNSSGKNTMYFKFHQDMFTTAAPDVLTFKIIWLDKTPNSTWSLKYYNATGLQTALNVTGIGDNQWKTINVTLQNPVINQGGTLGSDFMLVNTDGIDDIFHGIEVDITRKVSTLPIQLLVFNAVANNNQAIALDWTTATEQNSKSFEIQKSTDGLNFTKIGAVDAAGNSNTDKRYLYNDLDVDADVLYYYRLKSIDLDNMYNFSRVVSAKVQSKNTLNDINIYPNPNTDHIIIDIENFSNFTGYEIKVFNVLGQVVFQSVLENKITYIDSKDWGKSGVYFIRIINSEGKLIGHEKIIKK